MPGPIHWVRSRMLRMGLTVERDPLFRTFKSGAIRKAIVEYGQSSTDPQIKAFMPHVMRHSDKTAQVITNTKVNNKVDFIG